MARLTAADRRALPKSDFAVPSKAPGPGSYPIPDREHAGIAKGMAAQHASPAVAAKVDAKANRKLGRSKNSGAGTHTPPRRHAPMPHGFTRGPQHHT
jgi:hypothetical protein